MADKSSVHIQAMQLPTCDFRVDGVRGFDIVTTGNIHSWPTVWCSVLKRDYENKV